MEVEQEPEWSGTNECPYDKIVRVTDLKEISSSWKMYHTSLNYTETLKNDNDPIMVIIQLHC